VRRRRRDLAVLKTLGFTRWEVLRTVAWEASALAPPRSSRDTARRHRGRVAWALFADATGIASQATVNVRSCCSPSGHPSARECHRRWPGWTAAGCVCHGAARGVMQHHSAGMAAVLPPGWCAMECWL